MTPSTGLSHMSAPIAWLSLGSNVLGRWGSPSATMSRAIVLLEQLGIVVISRSRVFLTPPVGPVRQPSFANMVIAIRSAQAPATLLRQAKQIEHAAGRRAGVRWGPRPLDIDILSFGGRRINAASAQRVAGRLVLPHPEMHRRGFVLVPLAQIAPQWRHPVNGSSARSLLLRQPHLARGIRLLGQK